MTYCEDCGCKVFSGRCTNCHEELFTLDQYEELKGTDFELPMPDENSKFMKRVNNIYKSIYGKPQSPRQSDERHQSGNNHTQTYT